MESKPSYMDVIQAVTTDIAELPEREGQRLLQSWRQVYAAELHARTGKWTKGGFEWHVFSYDFARARKGPRALECAKTAHRLAPGVPLLIYPADATRPALRCKARELPWDPLESTCRHASLSIL